MSDFQPDADLEDVTDTIGVGPTFPVSGEENTSPTFSEVPTFPEVSAPSEMQDESVDDDNTAVSQDDNEGDDDIDDNDDVDDEINGVDTDIPTADVPVSDDDDDGDDDDDDDDDGDDDDDDDEDGDDDGNIVSENNLVSAAVLPESFVDNDDDDDTEDEDDDYLQKLDKEVRENFLADYHPESQSHNYEEVKSLAKVTRNKDGQVIDALHRTLPFLTKYEKTRILGQRAKQIDAGAKSFVKTENNVLDGYIIAQAELKQKKIPFIIKRPLPNGGFEYWNIRDLELVH